MARGSVVGPWGNAPAPWRAGAIVDPRRRPGQTTASAQPDRTLKARRTRAYARGNKRAGPAFETPEFWGKTGRPSNFAAERLYMRSPQRTWPEGKGTARDGRSGPTG